VSRSNSLGRGEGFLEGSEPVKTLAAVGKLPPQIRVFLGKLDARRAFAMEINAGRQKSLPINHLTARAIALGNGVVTIPSSISTEPVT
jgi:hypothetical protein